MYSGIPGSDGIGIGNAVLIPKQELIYEQNSALSADEEIKRFDAAAEEYMDKTSKKAEEMRKNIGDSEAEILMGHVLMLSDPSMTDEVRNKIREGVTAEYAAEQVFDMFAMIFEGTGDELTMQRASDLRDIKTGIIKTLLGLEDVSIAALPKGSVIVADDLTPSMTAEIIKENIQGIVTAIGGRTSHSAILARALEIPAVMGIGGITEALKDGQQLIVDGSEGKVIADPDESTVSEYEKAREEFLRQRQELMKLIGHPSVTADGTKVELVCNIGTPGDCAAVMERDGEGIGLFRTEFLFMDSETKPDEEQQFEAYKKVAMTMKGKPVIIRTLDVGGDKGISYLDIGQEDNPFMGFRAVRYCLKNKDLYKEQLRALLRASAFGNIKIMVPLVTCVDEIREVKAMVKELMAELDQKGVEYDKSIQVGVMMETAAAAVIADLLAAEADFFSIGTNDLTGYTMAADRGNANVAYLYSAYNPAVLRNIKRIIECGKAENIMVGMCGEAAADPCLAPLLISFGLDEYSVSPTSVLATRATLLKWTKAEADKVAEQAMSCATEAEVKAILESNKR